MSTASTILQKASQKGVKGSPAYFNYALQLAQAERGIIINNSLEYLFSDTSRLKFNPITYDVSIV